ncbi:MAG TPA: CinA family nicotinamide mononucleotide deamidase-related protein [Caldilineaceae bacterium]|nr:CinA family nicotinamide mononucleotide deamidase-related protein [Caldilineaceae bacterium]
MPDAIASGLKAEIITTGTEILLGEIVDTNAAWIAQQLREAGVNLYYKTTVGDNEARIREVVELGMSRSDVVICSGGIGPTVDDVTRQAIAKATGRPLILHEDALATLKERFARFGVAMTENNLQQAYIPEGALLIPNPVGTAAGFIVETERSTVLSVPGVPREMKHLMTETVLPYLRTRAGHTGIIRRRVLRTIGIGESMIDATLGQLMYGSNPTVGLAAHTAQVDVRITARAESAEAAEVMLDALETEVRRHLDRYIYSVTPGESYETVVVRRLQSAGATLSLLETNTRGTLAARIHSAVPEFDPLIGNWVAGESTIPASLVSHLPAGEPADLAAVEAHAAAAATALQAESGATLALVLLGSAGADEGVYGRRSGETWLALASAAGVKTTHCPFGGQDEYTLIRIGNQALGLLQRAVDDAG